MLGFTKNNSLGGEVTLAGNPTEQRLKEDIFYSTKDWRFKIGLVQIHNPNGFDINPTLGVEYKLNRKLSLEGGIDNNRSSGFAPYVGINYDF